VLATGQRLRRAADFATVIRRGGRSGRDGLVVHVHTRDADDRSERGAPDGPGSVRAGLVVSKAVGTAVTRNRVRRRLRHLLRNELTRLAPGTDVVVRVLPEAATRSYGELGRHLSAALDAARSPRSRRSARG
jgi:ribonuclease P protein component